ncbi:MAG: hypothetical protein ACRCT8_12150 [Lacipirellulaceae bacterium]
MNERGVIERINRAVIAVEQANHRVPRTGKRSWPGVAGVVAGGGVAQLNGVLTSGAPTATIDNFRSLEGAAPDPLPTSALNTYSLSGADNTYGLLRKSGADWVLVALMTGPQGPSGGGEDHPQIVAEASNAFGEDNYHVSLGPEAGVPGNVRAYVGMDPLGSPPEYFANPHRLAAGEKAGLILVPTTAVADWAGNTSYTAGQVRKADRSDIGGTLVKVYRRIASGTSLPQFNASEAANWVDLGAAQTSDWKVVFVEGAQPTLLVAKVASVPTSGPIPLAGVEVLVGAAPDAMPSAANRNGFAPAYSGLTVFLAPAAVDGEWDLVYVIEETGRVKTSAADDAPDFFPAKYAGDVVTTAPGVGSEATLFRDPATHDWSIYMEGGDPVMLAELSANLTTGMTSVAITAVEVLAGEAPSALPTTALSTAKTGTSGDIVALKKDGANWRIAKVWKRGGALTPCWVTDGCSKASLSGGNITAQTVTIYRDELGAGPANRVKSATGETAYWDDPASGISLSSGKMRRGYVVVTSLGTLDVMWVGCKEYTLA